MMKPTKIFYVLCTTIAFLLCADTVHASPNAINAPLIVKIYSVKPTELFGISRLRQEAIISDVQIIDVSIVPRMETMFSAAIHGKTDRPSIAEIKNLSDRLPRTQLQKLADAHISLFDLRMQYDVTIDDLPIVIFEQSRRSYLYKGSDAYEGFLIWKESEK